MGIDGTVHKGQFIMRCPDPDHTDNKPSAAVHLVDGLWNCFSCPAKGDIIDLGKLTMGASYMDVMKVLRPNDPGAILNAVRRRLEARKRAAKPVRAPKGRTGPLVPSRGSYEDGPLDYLLDRGFDEKTLRRWGVRFASHVTLFREEGKSFTLDNAIAIPVLSERRRILAWCYRATEASPSWFREVRYIYTPGVTDTLNKTWFGMHFHKDSPEITVVEGALDAMWCDQHGIPAVAILGSQVKQMVKVRKLMDFRKVTILTDKDTAGVTTAMTLGTALQERGVACSVSRYQSWMLSRKGKPAKDAQELCGLDLELTQARAIPFLLWKQGGNRAA